jgi:hypothetical protein
MNKQTIADLSASQIARHAVNILAFQGRTIECARLIHHALALNPDEATALGALSSYLDQKDFEAFSAAVLEYACSSACPIPEDKKSELDDLRFQVKWLWGFSSRVDGQKYLRSIEFGNRSDFVVDEERYQDWLIKPLVEKTGSLRNAVDSAHVFLGCVGRLLIHRELGGIAPFEEIYHPERFIRAPKYDEWLASPITELEAIEKEFSRRRKAN